MDTARDRTSTTVRPMAAAAVLSLTLAGCSSDHDASSTTEDSSKAAALSLTITAEHPHDPAAFTQGLELLDDGRLAESTGQYGESTVRIVQPETGVIDAQQNLSPLEFGEGLTVVDGEILQLTWKAGVMHTWQVNSLERGEPRSYDGEGWGLCYDEDDDVLWRSDGSATLTAHDSESFAALDETLEVTHDGAPVEHLNELECTADGLWASVWKSTEIMRIDPDSGHVTGVLDAAELQERAAADAELGEADVLNGIAYDAENDRWFITGKRWPTLFEVTIETPSN